MSTPCGKGHRDEASFAFAAIFLFATLTLSTPSRGEPGPDKPFSDPVASLSRYDNLDAMISSGFQFDHIELVIHRCTTGIRWIDAEYENNKAKLKRVNIPHWGAFTFLHPEMDIRTNTEEPPQQQAEHFLRVVLAKRDSSDRKIILSVSWFAYNVNMRNSEGNSPPKLVWPSPKAAATACSTIHRLTGTWPLLFTDIDFLWQVCTDEEMRPEDAEILANCDLWLGMIDTDVHFPPPFPDRSPWHKWTFCLYSAQDEGQSTPKQGNTKGVLPPDLSYSSIGRGAALDEWCETHGWDYVLKEPLSKN